MARTTRRPRRSWKKTLLWLIGIAAVLFVLIQFIPYGRTSHTNPAAANPFRWTNPKAEAIAKRSCYDCHSNRTKWWWATNIAPFSWLVQHDVDDGRARLNFSDFSGEPPVAYFQRSVIDGRMPQVQYTLIHPNAKLTDAEKRILVNGYRSGLAASGGSSSGGQSGAAPSAAATTASGDGAAIVNAQCSSCHGAPVGYHAGSAAEAQALIDNMVQQGASVTPAQEQALIQYFTQ
jgi:mono/diheme cytochrome c family protein